MNPRYVQHDGSRWRVVGFVEIDGGVRVWRFE